MRTLALASLAVAAATAWLATPAQTQETPVATLHVSPGPAALLAATAGRWTGELQYRDYQSNTWQGLPVEVTIVAQPDGVTTVRTAAYDDGPQTGTVWITTTAIVDPATGTQSYAIMRRGRPLDTGTTELFQPNAATDSATHWTIIANGRQRDGDTIAYVRETTIRDGATMTTVKEVNPDGDGNDEWLPRNRIVLTLAADASAR